MLDAFAAAIDAIFRDANVAEDAVWRAGGAGDGITVRVVTRRPDQVVGFGDSRAVLPSVLIDVRRSEVVEPAAGDIVEIAGEAFEIIAVPVADSLGLVWTCEGVAK
ncbi:MAG TPA: hypothetical protein VNK48_08185 [Xanthobacteraceae bacterium]|nr:hypothetical protein [Xanthobacteraceae bacterium]